MDANEKVLAVVRQLLESTENHGALVVIALNCENGVSVSMVTEGDLTPSMFFGGQQILLSKMMEASGITGLHGNKKEIPLPARFDLTVN